MSTHNGTPLQPDSLSTIKSTFNFSRRARPPPPTELLGQTERTPLGPGAAKLSRRESRGGLRSIFTRNKTAPEMTRPLSPTNEVSQRNTPLEKPQLAKGKTDSEVETVAGRVYAKTVASAPEKKVARMSIIPQSTKPRPVSRGHSKPSGKPVSKSPRRTLAAWDPPPLFQAYPQAIKHAQLSSSAISADSILRMSNHKRNSSMREDTAQLSTAADEVQTADAKKKEKTRSKHERQLSGSLSKAEWTQKIYMLVTSGYLLQYSGEGSFDRLPEKMMLLGKDSVAFASDVIPGKHWVLQISQAMDPDGNPAPDPRSLLSRLAFRGTDYRRAATSFLLILDSAEELESWINTVRREIEALGGQKYVTETGKPKIDEEIKQLKSRTSQRFLVQRDPERFSNPSSPRLSSFEPQWMQSGDVDHPEPSMASLSTQYLAEPSPNRLSVATSSASHDSQPYDSLKDNSFRLSYMSSGQRTLVTSQGSTPACSPTKEAFITMVESGLPDHTEDAPLRPNGAAINERRRSMQAIQKPAMKTYVSELQVASKKSQIRPHSTYGGPGRSVNVQSPSTPNFSVPHSVSKRYTLARIPDNTTMSSMPRVKTPPEEQSWSMKGSRKSPPAPIEAPQLSPVQDYPSPIKQLIADASAASSGPKAQVSRHSIGDNSSYSRSDSPRSISTSSTNSPVAGRRSSYMSPKSPRVSQNSSHSKRRQTSLQALPDSLAEMPETSSKGSSTQPASPNLIPLPPSPIISSVLSDAMPVIEVGESFDSLDKSKTSLNVSKPRRPASMQVLTSTSTTSRSPMIPSPNGTVRSIRRPAAKFATPPRALLPSIPSQVMSAPNASSALSSPSVQGLKAADAKKNLINRRSMPHLVKGPPPAPPPSYALPPIPPRGMRSPLAMKANRSSVMI